jgi:hypothetical protein
MSKKRKKKKKSRLVLIFLLIALVLLFVALFLSFQIWKVFEKKEIQRIEIIDGCSLFMEQILHQIRDIPDCENSCRSECYLLSKEFYEVEFQEPLEGCNTCICYCK